MTFETRTEYLAAYAAGLRHTVNVVAPNAFGFSGLSIASENDAYADKAKDDENKKKDGKEPSGGGGEDTCGSKDGPQTDDEHLSGCNRDKESNGGFWDSGDGQSGFPGWIPEA